MELGALGYAKQMALYLQNREAERAYAMGREFIAAHPGDALAYYMAALAAHESGRYGEAASWAKRAFSLSESRDDMLAAAILCGLALYRIRDFQGGLKMLKGMEGLKTNEDLEELLVAFSLAARDDSGVLAHIDRLSELNRKKGKSLIKKILDAGGS